ncbi:MAG: flagellar assembly protein FliW [Armatimonadota bacterium]
MTTLAINTTRFGELTFEQADLVTFINGIVGFPDCRQFVLIQHKEDSPYRWLQSVDDGSIAFLVVDPSTHVPEYAPNMPQTVAVQLGMNDDTPRLVYTIVTIPRGRPHEMTINLAGPIVINAESGQAVQVVLEDDAYAIRHRVFNEATQAAA